MTADQRFTIGPFRFDNRTGQLLVNGGKVKLTPRAAAVLYVLADRAQELVTKQELFDRVWGGLAVSDDALTSCIRELRGAFSDDARRPQTIETWHRRGYRLMLPAVRTDQSDPVNCGATAPERVRLVGRETELRELARYFEHARSGRRQLVFLIGEPGIGKSALADCFLEQVHTERAVRTAHGQCLDLHGAGEPYLPLIEAVTRLARRQDGRPVKGIFFAQAPSWVAQMPSLWSRAERNALEGRGQVTRERMMREFTLALEAVASDVPLILKLEDIHWSDTSTLYWLGHVARRADPARLMILATFRPADAAAKKVGLHALVTELVLHGCCHEMCLDPLRLEAVESYLKIRLGAEKGTSQLQDFAPLLLDRTGGNPLFMTSIVNHLAKREIGDRPLNELISIPNDIRRFIDCQIDELSESDCALLMAASVVRREFAIAAVASALEIDVQQVEASCTRLARQGVFVAKGGATAWPDGTVTELYSFRHDLYRELLYDRLPATHRASCHARVGCRLEVAWAGQLEVVAAELAEHFERAGESVRAISHHQRAAATALRRSFCEAPRIGPRRDAMRANEEAIEHLRRALNAIGHIPDKVERTRTEIDLQVAIGAAFMASKGFAASEVLEAYARAEVLCDGLGECAEIFPAIWGQWLFRYGRGELDYAWRLCARLRTLADDSGDTGFKLQAHHAMWPTLFLCGELSQSHGHAHAGLSLYDAKIHQTTASSYGNHDTSACACSFAAMSLALLGKDEHAREMIDTGLRVATSLKDPFSLALTLYLTAAAAQMMGDVQTAARNSESSVQISAEYGLALMKVWSTALAGWCAVENGERDRGFTLLIEATGTLRTIGSLAFLPYLLGLLSDARHKAGQHLEAMNAVNEAIAVAETTGQHFYDAELHRLLGELLAQPSVARRDEAKAAFRRAIKIAAQQGALPLERKAKDSLRRWFS